MPADTTIATIPTDHGPATLLLSADDLARELRVSKRTLARLISAGKFPGADVVIGAKIRRWQRAAVEQWITNQTTK